MSSGHKCSLARARNFFAIACVLGFSLKIPYRVEYKHNLHLENKN